MSTLKILLRLHSQKMALDKTLRSNKYHWKIHTVKAVIIFKNIDLDIWWLGRKENVNLLKLNFISSLGEAKYSKKNIGEHI